MFERCVLTFTTNRNFATSRALRVCIAIVGVSAASSLIAAAQPAVQHAFAEDTTRVALADLDATFLLRNLAIIAARFNVDATAAAIEQARLWPNPNISTEQIVNAGGRPPFDFTRTGNTDISLSQLIVLAGKRSKQVQLATISRDVAQYQVADLLRALRFELRSDFFSLYYLQRAVGFDDRIIASLAGTITAAERMYESRSLLLSELVRLRALLLTVQAERLSLQSQIRDLEGSLRILLHDERASSTLYVPILDPARLDSLHIDTVSVAAAVASARTMRPDVRIAAAGIDYETTNLSLQRALRTPDVTLAGHYSRNGSFLPDYFGFGVAIDLPIFNRNQGNINVSRANLQANRQLAAAAAARAERDVLIAYQKAVDTDQLYRALDRRFLAEYDRLVEGTSRMYVQRDITIIQFTDFFDSYRQTMQQLSQLATTRVNAFEALNFAAGRAVVTP